MVLHAAHWGGSYGEAPVVCATVAWNGLAFTAHQTWAFRRAELTAFAETPFRCANGERATMAHIRELPPTMFGVERLERIGVALMEQVTQGFAGVPHDARIGLLSCLPERFADGSGSDDARRRPRLERALAAPFRTQGFDPQVKSYTRGNAALAFALIDAGQALMAHTLDVAVVGGLDTSYDPEAVETLLSRAKLFDGENLDSLIPGEGGAFLVLTRGVIARQVGWPVRAYLESAVTQQEPASMETDLACAGVGLSSAMLAVGDRVRAEQRSVAWWVGDLTPETYRTHEFLLALPRASGVAANGDARMEFLPPLLGDLGAATLPTGVAVAVEAFQRGDPDAANCMLFASSVGEDRGVVFLTRANP